ncbi:hypothetical protein CEUSTIGMA_g10495.t1 [Chlamydomonas eustigma]|uniref:RWP-RK domain-containing protein n=1 Tax=Chlamydomonas eustigma TaxID=1157962 RepID=A0A250XJH2_9CHLO|nr:hypothetical protein CEUSTIGMA_g10495.t1 [Chlamydomonas eustigma]|eukprot:GAX83069.1 hypothetical protein CEUSTIGMA_g10495.t1 [Chlamydomonas eustigma]
MESVTTEKCAQSCLVNPETIKSQTCQNPASHVDGREAGKGCSLQTSTYSKIYSLDQLKKTFHLSGKAAASVLGVSCNALKRLCRSYGIARWPYRKVQGLLSLRLAVENDSNITDFDREVLLHQINKDLEKVMDNPNSFISRGIFDLCQVKYKQACSGRQESEGEHSLDARPSSSDQGIGTKSGGKTAGKEEKVAGELIESGLMRECSLKLQCGRTKQGCNMGASSSAETVKKPGRKKKQQSSLSLAVSRNLADIVGGLGFGRHRVQKSRGESKVPSSRRRQASCVQAATTSQSGSFTCRHESELREACNENGSWMTLEAAIQPPYHDAATQQNLIWDNENQSKEDPYSQMIVGHQLSYDEECETLNMGQAAKLGFGAGPSSREMSEQRLHSFAAFPELVCDAKCGGRGGVDFPGLATGQIAGQCSAMLSSQDEVLAFFNTYMAECSANDGKYFLNMCGSDKW